TLEDQPSGGFDLTVGNEPPPAPAPRPGSKPTVNWPPEPAGSDLFAESGRSSPEFDLANSGDLSPFDPTLKADQPSLGSAPSSIFSGGKVPGAGAGEPSGASGSVPVGKPDQGDEVDFSDHPEVPGGSTILRSPAGRGDGDSGNIDWAA